MKVFISWSGTRSKKIASIFRDWLPTVIQALDPFVSSEDIEKGARWNTDIAQELKESNFGLICVTKDNLTSPWLNFEAGALSKTIDNSYVAPLLFDVKPSDLKGSPISQFQATSFNEDDMKRLVETLNTAAGNCLPAARLNKAFELCYPDLKKSIDELKTSNLEEDEESENTHVESNILEELLEMTRNTQRLLGNTDTKLYNNIDQVQKKIDNIISRIEKQQEFDNRRSSRRLRPAFVENVLLFNFENETRDALFPYNILIILSPYKDDFPWLYDTGSELVKIINSNNPKENKIEAVNNFRNVLEFTFSHPIMRDYIGIRKEAILLRELPSYILKELELRP